MSSSTLITRGSTRRRYAKRAALTLAALLLGATACGTETGSDDGPSAALAAAPQAQSAPHPPTSADAAERRAASERRAAQQAQARYLRQLRNAIEKHPEPLKLRRSHLHVQGGGGVPAA
ncbi:MAG TPA: hypothetical protein VFV89_15720 [Nocardioides sp.]|uniref:hypothetical protein n=1 Tax=Nocardioides sp. TaxID=35761 RepID=UPI002E2EA61B|nr:hypothetical protein [Nocardioides sp.]HEX5089257.1 hypothetical protein [Nocardioides sp.]